jgi:hypothetical protein
MIKTMQRMLATACCLVPLGLVGCSSSSGGTSFGDGGTPQKDSAPSVDTGKTGDTGGGKTHDTGSGDTGGGSGTAVTTFCTEFLGAEAKAASQCFGGPVSDWAAQVGAGTSCPEVAAAVAAGRVTYQASEGATCLTDLAGIDCSTITTASSEPAACAAAFAGTVATGGACDSSLDCSSTDFCSGLGGVSGSCSGTCKAQIAVGDSCTAADVCASGSVCTGSPATCTAEAAPVGMGATCLYDTASKKAAPACQLGLACDLTTFKCVSPIVPGDPCPPGHGICAPFTYCDPTSKTCKADPTLGGRCGDQAGEDAIPCIGPTFCKGTSATATAGTCAALGASGATCEATVLAPVDGQCASGSCSVTDGGAGSCSAVCTAE